MRLSSSGQAYSVRVAAQPINRQLFGLSSNLLSNSLYELLVSDVQTVRVTVLAPVFFVSILRLLLGFSIRSGFEIQYLLCNIMIFLCDMWQTGRQVNNGQARDCKYALLRVHTRGIAAKLLTLLQEWIFHTESPQFQIFLQVNTVTKVD